MGLWTSLTRYSAPALRAAIGNDWFEPSSRISAAVQHGRLVKAQEVATHRAWHAIHVALTGEETDGEPSAAWIVGFENGGSRVLFSEAAQTW